MNAMNQGPPADFAEMGDRLLILAPILMAGLAVVGLLIWLSMKWRDARNSRKHVDVVDDVRETGRRQGTSSCRVEFI